MINSTIAFILISLCSEDINFGAFPPNNAFSAQALPNYIKSDNKNFAQYDKFGRLWKHTDKNVLTKYIDQINKEPFIATDKFGKTWECDDREILESFIKERNKDYYESKYKK